MTSTIDRIIEPLPEPESCDICSGRVAFQSNDNIYGRRQGDWPFVWRCLEPPCGAYVACHPRTRIPMGRMADRATRSARQRAHVAFDVLWKEAGPKRRSKRNWWYRWLARKLGIRRRDCHIGYFDAETCERVIEICEQRRREQIEAQIAAATPRTMSNAAPHGKVSGNSDRHTKGIQG